MRANKAPERIWRMNGTHGQAAYTSSVLDLPSDDSTFYVREDIHQALKAERDMLREALEEIQGMGFDMPMTLELTREQWAQRRSRIMQQTAGSALEDKQ